MIIIISHNRHNNNRACVTLATCWSACHAISDSTACYHQVVIGLYLQKFTLIYSSMLFKAMPRWYIINSWHLGLILTELSPMVPSWGRWTYLKLWFLTSMSFTLICKISGLKTLYVSEEVWLNPERLLQYQVVMFLREYTELQNTFI